MVQNHCYIPNERASHAVQAHSNEGHPVGDRFFRNQIRNRRNAAKKSSSEGENRSDVNSGSKAVSGEDHGGRDAAWKGQGRREGDQSRDVIIWNFIEGRRF